MRMTLNLAVGNSSKSADLSCFRIIIIELLPY